MLPAFAGLLFHEETISPEKCAVGVAAVITVLVLFRAAVAHSLRGLRGRRRSHRRQCRPVRFRR
jgi:hypothetical protein